MVAFFEAHIERAIAMRARFPRTNGSMLQIFFQNVESSMIHETNQNFHHPWIFLGSSAKVGRNLKIGIQIWSRYANQKIRRRYSCGLILDAKRRSQRFSRAFGHIQFIVFMSPVCSGAGIHQAEASSSRGATWDIYLSRLAIYLDAEYVYSFW